MNTLRQVPAAVCVAIPVKNGTNYLDLAIESVLAQEGVDLEVRVRDNGSDDDSVALARAWAHRDRRVSVAVNEEDVGYYGSLNRILADTEADWFVPFAHDDVMQPGNLAKKLAALERADARFAHSSALNIDASGAVIGIAPNQTGVPEVMDAPSFFGHITPTNMVACQSVLVRTAALRAIGGFDFRGYYAADWLTWLRLSLRERAVTLAEPLIATRVHAASGTTSQNAEGINGRDMPAVLEAVFRDDAMPPDFLALCDPMMATNLATVARMLQEDGVRRVAQGWAAYMTLGRALERTPGDGPLQTTYRTFVDQSGLVPPHFPWDAVALAPADEDDAADLAAAIDRLGPLLGTLGIAAPPDRADEALRLLEPHFGDTDLDVAIVPTADPAEMLVPGRVVLARWGSDLVARAEEAKLPVHPYALPSLFAVPPDRERWQTLDPDAALPATPETGPVRSRG